MIRWTFLLVLSVLVPSVSAKSLAEMHVIQTHSTLPDIQVWLDLHTPEVLTLQKDQFTATLGSTPLTVSKITPATETEEGVGYIFLVDISKSMSQRQFQQMQAAMTQWLEGFGPKDQAALLSFGDQTTWLSDFTADKDALKKYLMTLKPTDMNTSLYKALLEAIQLGRRSDTQLPHRRSIVLLSDGQDDSLSGVTFDEISRQLDEVRVPIYAIGFAPPSAKKATRDGLKTLSVLSRQSGGYFVSSEDQALADLYALQRQHIIGAYQLTLSCATCTADGLLQRLNVHLQVNEQVLNDNINIRLLPDIPPPLDAESDTEATQAKPKDVSSVKIAEPMSSADSENDADMEVYGLYGIAAGVLALLLLLFWRLRTKQNPPASASEPVSVMPENLNPTQPQKSKSSATLSVTLAVVTGPERGKEYRLTLNETAIIGRASDAALCLSDDVEVSGQHAVICYEQGVLYIQDLNSTNGTAVNGIPIHTRHWLSDGDLILIGRTEFRLVLPDPAL